MTTSRSLRGWFKQPTSALGLLGIVVLFGVGVGVVRIGQTVRGYVVDVRPPSTRTNNPIQLRLDQLAAQMKLSTVTVPEVTATLHEISSQMQAQNDQVADTRGHFHEIM